jgi:hypothetical protein
MFVGDSSRITRAALDKSMHMARFGKAGFNSNCGESELLHQITEQSIPKCERFMCAMSGLPKSHDTCRPNDRFELAQVGRSLHGIDADERYRVTGDPLLECRTTPLPARVGGEKANRYGDECTRGEHRGGLWQKVGHVSPPISIGECRRGVKWRIQRSKKTCSTHSKTLSLHNAPFNCGRLPQRRGAARLL